MDEKNKIRYKEIKSGRPKKTENDEIDEIILQELFALKTQSDIARELGIEHSAISKRIKRMRERGIEITIEPNKLKNENIDKKIIEGIEKGKTQRELAKELYLAPSTISLRIKRKREKEKKIKTNLAKMIVNLIHTKHATIEQVKTMGEYYGVNVEEVLNSLDEQER